MIENSKHRRAFEHWRDQGEKRTLKKTATDLGLSYRTLKRWRLDENWPGELHPLAQRTTTDILEQLHTTLATQVDILAQQQQQATHAVKLPPSIAQLLGSVMRAKESEAERVKEAERAAAAPEKAFKAENLTTFQHDVCRLLVYIGEGRLHKITDEVFCRVFMAGPDAVRDACTKGVS